MIVGEQRKYLTAIFTFKTKVNRETGVPTDWLTAEAKLFMKKRLDINDGALETVQ